MRCWRCAQNSGARLKRNVAVKSVIAITPAGARWNVLCDDGETICCRHFVLATGKLGLRGVDDARDGSLVGLKMHLRLSPEARRALEGRVGTLLLLQDGDKPSRTSSTWNWIEDGIANLCFVLSRGTVARARVRLARPARPYLASSASHLDRASGTRRTALGQAAGRGLSRTGGHLHRKRGTAVYRVGDRFAHIPPFTGRRPSPSRSHPLRLAVERFGSAANPTPI